MFITIGVRIVTLATATEAASVSPVPLAGTTERGQILDRRGRLMATNLPMTVLHADPSEIMDVTEAALQLAPLIAHHDETILILKHFYSKTCSQNLGLWVSFSAAAYAQQPVWSWQAV